jgi:2-dehydro-3-deoxyphosphogluconate aldolase/(4S)-4-hydroxy-2-oxoglutarate aldolase
MQGIVAADIPIAEITLTIPGGLELIKELVITYEDRLLVGAGTVLDAETCRLAVLAGAEFVVSPALDLRTIEMARRYGKVCIPGALTPTEVLAAWQAGADLVKIFPCGSVGGPAYISALKGPFPQIEIVGTGGVNLESAPRFLAAGATAVGVGELIFDKESLHKGNATGITANARRFVDAIRAQRLVVATN